uniref:Ig-like domain-containing protein n=1 Tax=Heterorhabditis bacteriophora TaxID=37862 RepID=A0A1I7WYG4_HETBA
MDFRLLLLHRCHISECALRIFIEDVLECRRDIMCLNVIVQKSIDVDRLLSDLPNIERVEEGRWNLRNLRGRIMKLMIRNDHFLCYPPQGATLISVQANSTVILKCEQTDRKILKVQWLHNGRDLDLKYVRTSSVLDSSSITVDEYDFRVHDGVYECYVGTYSASFRLRGEDDVILPTGFRFCKGFENNQCDHARACMADGLGYISCINFKYTKCDPGWMGQSCNVVQTANVISEPVCPYWPPLVTLMAFITCIFVISICLYQFNAKVGLSLHIYNFYRSINLNVFIEVIHIYIYIYIYKIPIKFFSVETPKNARI